ncbi:MAG: hypothetical protein K0S01_1509 [Herbinix sp.]|nr:hypothetical protein [Herbinix sp.]
MRRAICAAIITLILGYITEVILAPVNLHFGSIVSITVMGAFIINEINKKNDI